jgi:hypothetical protein
MSGSIEVPVALSAQNGVQVVDWKILLLAKNTAPPPR